MVLAEDQYHLVGSARDLLMGAGTRFDVQDGFNPFRTSVRAGQGGERPYAHGSWTGAEWQEAKVVPIRVIANAADPTHPIPSTRAAIQEMTAAFAAVGATGEVAELRFRLKDDSDEFLLFGQPRGVEPDLSTLENGHAYVNTAFVAADPRVYSAALTTVSTPLAVQRSGLRFPFRLPFRIPGRLEGGYLDLVNTGTAPAALAVRIDGPAPEPRLILRRPDGVIQSITMGLDLAAGQWLEIDTARRTVLLNGLAGSNQRGRSVWDMDAFPLLPGTNVLRFLSGVYDAAALLTVSYRSAWW